MKSFNCDTRWPICLFDFTYKNKIPEYTCLRTSSSPPIVIVDYFYTGYDYHSHEQYR